MSAVTAMWLFLASVLSLALVFDFRYRRIPNWLILIGLSGGFLSGQALGSGLVNALGGTAVGLAIFFPLYLLRGMGAGDVKLMAVVGSLLGPTSVIGAGLLALLAGGVLSLGVAVMTGALHRVLNNLRLMGVVVVAGRTSKVSLHDVQTTGRLPYALAICVGTALQILLTTQAGWPFK